MRQNHFAALGLALTLGGLLGGCGASLPSLSTGSLFGGDAPKAAAVAQNDITSRAIQAGGTVARAQKCGFNIDGAKLREQFIAAETAASPADAAKASQLYDTAYRGVSRALSAKGEEYCSNAKTTVIKAALTRQLAGDFTPDAAAAIGGDDSMLSLSLDGIQ